MYAVNQLLGNTDIYLIDQILKGRYKQDDIILDAGCGEGRNLQWFIANDISIIGIDRSAEAIQKIQSIYPTIKEKVLIGDLTRIPFPNNYFDHIISSAVLHFSENESHFTRLFEEHLRVLKADGSFFIRMASDIGIEDLIVPIGDGVYQIPDDSTRFLLTRKLADDLINKHQLKYLEPLKTTNVNDVRCMTTWILARKSQ